jgi:hypothetical protein
MLEGSRPDVAEGYGYAIEVDIASDPVAENVFGGSPKFHIPGFE